MGLLAVADDVAESHGARNVADWYAGQVHLDYRAASAIVRVAKALDARHAHLHQALLAGDVTWDQTRVIALGLDELPGDLDAETLEQAERHLIAQAAQFAPAQLRILTRKILEVIAPDTYEDHERKALEDEERRAAVQTFLRFRPNGDGTVRITGRISDAAAHRLRTYLEARTAPRQGASLDHPRASPTASGSDTRSSSSWRTCPPTSTPSTAAPPRR